jgi:uncharacterized protein (DUF4213/DUF364 family)
VFDPSNDDTSYVAYLYFIKNSGASEYETHTYSLFNETLVQLDEKYLPDTVVLESELTEKGYQTEEQVTTIVNNALDETIDYVTNQDVVILAEAQAYADSLIGTGISAITIEEIDEICNGTLNTFLDEIASEEVSF